MPLVQYSWSIAAFAKQVALILLIFLVQKSPQPSSTCVSKRNACLVLGPPLSPLSSWSSCWRGWSNLCLTPLTPFTLKCKTIFRFHEETYHFALLMIGLRLERLNGIKPCISTNAWKCGKRITFHTDKTISFYPEKICNSSASHCYFGLKSNFLFATLTQSSTILHFEARVTWSLCCFLQLSL